MFFDIYINKNYLCVYGMKGELRLYRGMKRGNRKGKRKNGRVGSMGMCI